MWFRQCSHCRAAKIVCLIPLLGRGKSCSECRRAKRGCSVGSKVREWIASRQFESRNDPYVEISTVEDVRALELDWATKIVLLQLVEVKRLIRDLRLEMTVGVDRVQRLLSATKQRPLLHQAQPQLVIDVGDSGNDADGEDVTTTDDEYVDKPDFDALLDRPDFDALLDKPVFDALSDEPGFDTLLDEPDFEALYLDPVGDDL